MQDLAADLAKIKRYVHLLEDENSRLKEELARVAGPGRENPAGGAGGQEPRGIDNLMNLYDRGFHICNVYFGGIRGGDCLFCAAFMQKGQAVTPSR
ncbi:MAG: initiation control protein YabA [Bacillota bacterium]